MTRKLKNHQSSGRGTLIEVESMWKKAAEIFSHKEMLRNNFQIPLTLALMNPVRFLLALLCIYSGFIIIKKYFGKHNSPKTNLLGVD